MQYTCKIVPKTLQKPQIEKKRSKKEEQYRIVHST